MFGHQGNPAKNHGCFHHALDIEIALSGLADERYDPIHQNIDVGSNLARLIDDLAFFKVDLASVDRDFLDRKSVV